MPYADTLNSVENSLEMLGNCSYGLAIYPKKEEQLTNQPFWDYDDLNRIETYTGLLKSNMTSANKSSNELSFTLGVDFFATEL